MDIKPESVKGIISEIKNTLTDLVETISKGTAVYRQNLTMVEVHNWFSNVSPQIRVKAAYGVLAWEKDDQKNKVRIYQGLFDCKKKCILAQQYLLDKMPQELETEFANKRVILFVENTQTAWELFNGGIDV